MEEKQIAAIGTFCLNEAYEDYNKVNHGNVIKSGRTDKESNVISVKRAKRVLQRPRERYFTAAAIQKMK